MASSNHYDRYAKSEWGRSCGISKKTHIEPSASPIMRINTVKGQAADTLAINMLPSLSANHLEQIKSLEQAPIPQGDYIEFPPVDLDLLTRVIIPEGYRLSADTSKYRLLLSMDEHTLKVVLEEEYREANIILEDRQGNPITFNTRVKVIKVSLIGTIFYNLLITGFEAMEHMYGKSETDFSSDPAIPINVVLGYTTYGFTEAEDLLNDYVITVTQGEEVMVTSEGEQISRSSPLFFAMLQEGGQELTIRAPYTLTVAASPPPIC